MSVYEDAKNVKRFKCDNDSVWKLFSNLCKLIQRDQTWRHKNRREISIWNLAGLYNNG